MRGRRRCWAACWSGGFERRCNGYARAFLVDQWRPLVRGGLDVLNGQCDFSFVCSSIDLRSCAIRKPAELFQVRAERVEHEFAPGSVHQLREADPAQETYGMPEWLAVVQSALLNESATLFRRRYYTNGSHAEFILYMTDPQPEGVDVDALRQALRDSRGPTISVTCLCIRPMARRMACS